MKYQIPKTFMGKPVAGSLERVLAGLNGNTNNPQTQPPQIQPLANAPNVSGYIFVPSTGIYMAKERTHLGLNWYQTHEELQKENLRMPTIPEFIEYLKFLDSGYSDRNEGQLILDEIKTVRNPWRSEWLDARFEKVKRKMHIHSMHKYSNGNLVSSKSEVLEKCLMKDKTPGIDLDNWLNNSTPQGLPDENTPVGELYFWYPREGAVAGFVADSDWAGLSCGGSPACTIPSLGVFACAEGVAPKI
jgi:hypothetical protein